RLDLDRAPRGGHERVEDVAHLYRDPRGDVVHPGRDGRDEQPLVGLAYVSHIGQVTSNARVPDRKRSAPLQLEPGDLAGPGADREPLVLARSDLWERSR